MAGSLLIRLDTGFPPNRFEFLPAKSKIEESISISNFFPPNRGVDFYFEFLPAKSKIKESIRERGLRDARDEARDGCNVDSTISR
jgi:hypothetical protein